MSSFGQGNVNVNISGNAQGLVQAMNQAQQSTTKTMTTIQQQTAKTGGSVSRLTEFFSGNRGLIYSMGTIFGTITGVVAEFQLLEEANNSVAEATQKLTELQAEGKEGSLQYSQAQQQLEKAERFLRFTTRNLALAVSNFIPEILLLITNLTRGKAAAEGAGTAIQELGVINKATTIESNFFNRALTAQAAGFTLVSGTAGKTLVPMKDLRLATDAVGVATTKTGGIMSKFFGLITNKYVVILAAVTAAFLAFVENWGGFRDAVNQAGVALGNFLPILKGILEPMGKFGDWLATTFGNQAKKGTDTAKEGFKGLSKEAQQAAEDVQKAWEGMLDDLVSMTTEDRMKELKELGFGKIGRKRIEFEVEVVADKKKVFDSLAKSLKYINEFKLSPREFSKWADNTIESLQEAMKQGGGKLDFYQDVIDIIKKGKEQHKSGATITQEIAKWFQGLPAVIKDQLAHEGITEKTFLTNLGLNPETFGKVGAQVAAGLKQGLTQADIPKAIQEGISAGKAPIDILNSIFDVPSTSRFSKPGAGPTGFVDQFIKNITEGLKNGLTPDKMKDLGTNLGNAIVSSVTFVSDALTPLWNSFVAALKPLASPAGMAAAGTAIAEAIVGSVKWVANLVVPLVSGLATSLAPLFKKESLAAAGTNLQNAIVDSVKWVANVVAVLVSGLAQTLSPLMTPQAFAAAGTKLMDAIVAGAKFVGKVATDWVSQFGKDITTAVNNDTTSFNQTGIAIVSQVGAGMNMAVQKIDVKQEDWWKSFVNKIQAAVTGEGGILSYFTGQFASGKDKPPVDTSKLQQMTGKVTLSNTDAIVAIDTILNYWRSKSTTIAAIIPKLHLDYVPAIGSIQMIAKAVDTLINGINQAKITLAINNKPAGTALKQIAAAADALINGINKAKITITINNSQALQAINQVVQAQSKIRNITQTITTVYRTVGSPSGGGGVRSGRFNNPVGLRSANNPIGVGETVNTNSIANASNSGNINITLVNHDAFGNEKIKKLKAKLGQDRYVFGSVGAGG